jgi:hypothetical protein
VGQSDLKLTLNVEGEMMRNFLCCLFLVLSFFGNRVEARPEKPKLSDFRFNVYSQFGEDGIIETIFNTIGTKSKRCIEFGAWDGYYLSNAANLFVNHGWEAILIECSRTKFAELLNNVKKYKCTCICEAVGIGSQSLESILQRNSVSVSNIDLLSIDIDGNDYYIFESLEKMQPRVIICEYNPTFPAHLDIYAKYDENGREYGFGCSVGALVRIAKQKGYSLVALTECNAFFVRNDEIAPFHAFETSVDKLQINRYISYLITDFTGNYAIVAQEDSISPFGCNQPLYEPILGNVKKILP